MSSKPFFAKRHFILVGVASTIVLVAFSLLWGSPIHSRSATQFGVPNDFHDNLCSATTGLPADVVIATQPIRHRNIAIASTFGFHHDVYLALAWTMERVMDKHGKLQVYANLPFAYAFQDIVDQLGLYHGEVKPTPELIPAMKELGGDGGGIDMLILGTCEVDLRGDWHEQLLAAWDARDKDHKFTLVCIVHHVLDKGWQPHIADWARRGALRLLPISSHVAAGFRHSFDESADSTDPSIRHAGYEYIPIDIHIPILDLPNLPDRNDDKTLSKAVIQGSFSLDRRDYIHLFEDLKRSLAEDPLAWGYLPLDSRTSYIANPVDPSPFHLYLVGSGTIDVPKELVNIISVHVNLDYSDFYDLMARMDICVPAFAKNGYFEHQASSTFVMALECDVPILVTKRMRRSYAYADDDRVVITRPAALREIEVLKALRTRNTTAIQDNLHLPGHARDGIQRLEKNGWLRQKSDFLKFKQDIWRRNEAVVHKLLRDL